MAFSRVGYEGMEPCNTTILDAKTFAAGDLALLDLSPSRHQRHEREAVPQKHDSASTEDITPVAFIDLDEDVLLEIFTHLADDPLSPAFAAAIARATCCSLRALTRLQRACATLQRQNSSAQRLVAKVGLTLQRLGAAGKLTWAKKSLSDFDMVSLGVIPLPSLQEIDVRFNAIGDSGLIALAAASAAGRLPSLNALGLNNNRISDGGAIALASATSDQTSPAFGSIESLGLGFNRIGAGGMAALALAIGDGALPRITQLMLVSNLAEEVVVTQAVLSPSEVHKLP